MIEQTFIIRIKSEGTKPIHPLTIVEVLNMGINAEMEIEIKEKKVTTVVKESGYGYNDFMKIIGEAVRPIYTVEVK